MSGPWRISRRDQLLAHLLDLVTGLMTPPTRDVIRRGAVDAIREKVARERMVVIDPGVWPFA